MTDWTWLILLFSDHAGVYIYSRVNSKVRVRLYCIEELIEEEKTDKWQTAVPYSTYPTFELRYNIS